MARTDAIVLGAGIVGTSIALHLAKRGLSVALIDRRGPGEETSYGNAGVIEGNTLFPHAFPSGFGKLLKIALKQAPDANYHWSALLRIAPWLLAYRRHTRPEESVAYAEDMRPLFARAVAEHEALMAEAEAAQYLRKNGWIKLYRSDAAFAGTARERDFASRLGLSHRALSGEEARALEPSLSPVFRHAVHWPEAASVSNPLAVTKAYAERFVKLGGVILRGDARTLRRADGHWRADTGEGPVDAKDAVGALGPWSPDLLGALGIDLPMAYKRGYHRHFRPRGNAGLNRPIVDTEFGYCLAPMEQGVRLTTGAEFADRDAAPTPVQFDRLMPAANELFPLGEPVEAQPWLGSRPCFADSRPVIGRAPGQSGLWLACGHAHWGLTLGPVTGRLVADMITGATPFCDPAPYSVDRFAS
ncbi:MAG: FAD-binding oxidoreductase [Alphaproteobacteria bacterium]|nr:FAD-binding oxidoreductase [Alphaproteobacteria bacterium]